jgi:hypothetical protein
MTEEHAMPLTLQHNKTRRCIWYLSLTLLAPILVVCKEV